MSRFLKTLTSFLSLQTAPIGNTFMVSNSKNKPFKYDHSTHFLVARIRIS